MTQLRVHFRNFSSLAQNVMNLEIDAIQCKQKTFQKKIHIAITNRSIVARSYAILDELFRRARRAV